MGFILQILSTTINRLEGIISTAWGILFTCIIGMFNFFAGYKIALSVVLAAIIFDGIWGVAAARKTGKFILSELGKDTLKTWGKCTSITNQSFPLGNGFRNNFHFLPCKCLYF